MLASVSEVPWLLQAVWLSEAQRLLVSALLLWPGSLGCELEVVQQQRYFSVGMWE